MKKLLALILALMMALLCTAAFAEDVGEPFENEVFFTMLNSKPEITKALQAAADQFGAAYKVKIEVVETSNPGDEISKRYNGGEAPTISVVDIAQVKDLAREGKIADLGDQAPEDYIVHGPNRITALPMEVPVCYQEIAHCLEKTIAKIEAAVLSALEDTPPELYADIVHNGIYLTGGGALLRGLDKRLTDKINIPFHIAEDPLHSVAKGTGVALKNIHNFSFLM